MSTARPTRSSTRAAARKPATCYRDVESDGEEEAYDEAVSDADGGSGLSLASGDSDLGSSSAEASGDEQPVRKSAPRARGRKRAAPASNAEEEQSEPPLAAAAAAPSISDNLPSATSARAGSKRKAAPIKPATTASKRKTVNTGVISDNFVRHNLNRRSRGTASGPRSANSLRNEKWRIQRGLGARRKSATEVARERSEQQQDRLYVEALEPHELEKAVAAGPGDVAVESENSDADELAAFRAWEAKRFGSATAATTAPTAPPPAALPAVPPVAATAAVATATSAEMSMELDPEDQPISSMLANRPVEPAAKPSTAPSVKPRRSAPHSTAASIEPTPLAPDLLCSAAAESARAADYSDDCLRALLRQHWGYDDFRPGQLETIQRVLRAGVHDASSDDSAPSCRVLSILPTGGGKSLIYQMLSFLLPGLTLVVSPLLSLMRDQVEHLPPFLRGCVWSGESSAKHVAQLQADVTRGALKILFVSPEKLLSPGVTKWLSRELRRGEEARAAHDSATAASYSAPPSPALPPGVSLVVVDEVHCVAEWSHNFRSSYARLGLALQELRVPRVLGLTATATLPTRNQICAALRVRAEEGGIVTVPLRRDNLFVSVSRVRHEEKFASLAALLRSPPFASLSSLLVYVPYKSQCSSLVPFLRSQGLSSVDCYHAGLAPHVRQKVQDRFMSGRLRVLVATCAFGMGLDKRDVRGVVHLSAPRSVEGWSQEIGRAGRDGRAAWVHAMWSPDDADLARSLLYSHSVDSFQIERLLRRIFDPTKRPAPSAAMNALVSDNEEEMSAAGEYVSRVYVALDAEQLSNQMELSEEVVGTILARLERLQGQQWIRVISSLHNQVSVAFHKASPKQLAHSNAVIRALLRQNGWLAASSSRLDDLHGVESFESERAASDQYSAAEYAQLKQQRGVLTLDLCECAMAVGMDVAGVQRELLRLRAAGEVSLTWSGMASVVQVLRWPADLASSRSMNPGAGDEQKQADEDETQGSLTLDALVQDIQQHLQQQEELSSEKLSIITETLKIASLPQMHCTPLDSHRRGVRFERRALRAELSRSSWSARQKEKLRQELMELDKLSVPDEDHDPEYFDLHLVMDAYYQSADTGSFLEQLKQQYREAEAENAPLLEEQAKRKQQQDERDFLSDVASFLRSNGTSIASARELARIAHGLRAPSQTSERRADRSRFSHRSTHDPRDRDAAEGVDPFASLTPWVSHSLWGRYKSLPFTWVLSECERMLSEFRATQMSQMRDESREPDAKRRKTLSQAFAGLTRGSLKTAPLKSSSSSSSSFTVAARTTSHLDVKRISPAPPPASRSQTVRSFVPPNSCSSLSALPSAASASSHPPAAHIPSFTPGSQPTLTCSKPAAPAEEEEDVAIPASDDDEERSLEL